VSAIATALLFGMVPALQVTASRPDAVLKQDRHTGSAGSRLLPSLVTTQMALSLILLVGAGLFIRTLRNLHAQDPGFSGAGVFTARLEPRPGGLPAGVLDELRGLPGVLSASASTDPPMSGSIWSEPAVPAGQPLPEEDTAVFFGVSPDFFATLRIPVLTGRTFTAGDTRAAPPVAIVNEKFARRYFSGRPAVGRRLAYRHDPQVAEIVGVVADIRVYGLRDSPPPTVYLPHAQLSGDVRTTIEVRTAGPLNGLDAALRRILQPLSPRAPVEVQPMASQIEADLIRERMMATLGAGFGLLALVLAAVGVYGLLAYTVARRAREIGIRMALGARPSGVIVLVLRRAYVPVLIGVAVGAPAAWLMARSIASMLYGLTPLDPIAIGGAILALALIAHLAACLPARRAARVDPLIALRSE
jgi:predicted permease